MNLQNRASTPEDANRSGDTAEMYRRFIASVVDYAIYGLDTSGNVLSWNPGAQRMKGYTAEEIVGRHFSVFFTPEEVAAGKPAHELEVAARDGRFEDEDWRVRKDGSRFWANVVLSAVRNEQGEVTGFAKVTRDLTARREAEEQARRLAVEAAARAEVQRRSEELQRLNEQLEAQAVELELQEEESRTLAEHLQQANERSSRQHCMTPGKRATQPSARRPQRRRPIASLINSRIWPPTICVRRCVRSPTWRSGSRTTWARHSTPPRSSTCGCCKLACTGWRG